MLDRTSIYFCFDSLGLKLYVLNGYFNRGSITKLDISM